MPYELSWYTEKRIAHARLYGEVTTQDMKENNQRIVHDYLQLGTPPVHLLIDISAMEKFPTNLRQLKAASEVFLGEPSLGWMVTVGKTNTLERFLTSTLTQLFGVKLHMAADLEAALAFLEKYGTEVPLVSKEPHP